MAAVSAREIIDKAMLVAGVTGIGNYQSPTGTESQDSLDTLNFIIDTFKIQGLLNFATTVQGYQPNGGTSSFTVGPTGDLVAVRPPKIRDAYVRINPNTSSPLDIPLRQLSAEDYDAISLKTSVSSNITQCFYYEPTDPNGTVYIWPVAQAGASNTIYLRYDQLLSEYTNQDETIQLPPGYKQLLIYALADQLCIQYGIPNPGIHETYMSALDIVKRNNVRPVPMEYSDDAPGMPDGLYDARYGISF